MIYQFRFLFDECLSPELPAIAYSFGYEATHVRDIGRLGDADPALAVFAVSRDWVMVTNNRVDFMKLYKQFEIHPRFGGHLAKRRCQPAIRSVWPVLRSS